MLENDIWKTPQKPSWLSIPVYYYNLYRKA